MQLIKKAALSLSILGVLGAGALAMAVPAAAAGCPSGQVASGGSCVADASGSGCTGIQCITDGASNTKTGGSHSSSIQTFFATLTNMVLFVLGAIAVIMIVIGGVKYTTSNGSADQIKSAKNTVMYSIVGLVVAILAYAIVHFVISEL